MANKMQHTSWVCYRDSYETTAIKPHKLKSFYVESSVSRIVSVLELTCHPGPGATLSTFRRSAMTLARGNSGEIFWTTKSAIPYDGLNDRKSDSIYNTGRIVEKNGSTSREKSCDSGHFRAENAVDRTVFHANHSGFNESRLTTTTTDSIFFTLWVYKKGAFPRLIEQVKLLRRAWRE